MEAIAHPPYLIGLIGRFLRHHPGSLEHASLSTTVLSWQQVEELLGDLPWYSIDLDPQPARFVPLRINGRSIGKGWIPHRAVFSFVGLEGETVATLRIWLDTPQVLLASKTKLNNKAVEAIAHAFTGSFV